MIPRGLSDMIENRSLPQLSKKSGAKVQSGVCIRRVSSVRQPHTCTTINSRGVSVIFVKGSRGTCFLNRAST